MSLPLSVTAPSPTQRLNPEVARRSANFRPCFWGDRFLTYTSDDPVTHARKEQQIKELKDELKNELKATARKSSQLLTFIDSIQRLGLDMYQTYNLDDDDNDDLTNASLRFRLLRQEGYHIPPDVFNKFKDDEGNFKESLTGDLPGLLALYEATHLMVHGEDILEEALAFSTAHLQSMATDSTHPLQHKKELSEVTRWWKGLNFARKMPFARDRLVEGYLWILGVYFEPQYSLARRILIKVFAMISIIDDIYDAYGTFEELKLFTEAIERWDASSVDQLPDYMKPCYQALLDVYEEMEEEMAKEGNLYRVQYAKAAIKRQIQAYFVEAKWLNQEYTPTLDEYMSNALVSSGYSMLMTTSFVGMGDIATKEAFDWVFSDPKMVRASSVICRLMDDIVSHEFEQKRGHVASAVECYMKQHGVCKQEAYDELNKQVVNGWKDMNEECLKPTQVPMPLLTRVLNFSRVIDILYKDEDQYTLVGKLMKDLIASILIDPVPI
ncbi:hypothetical protein AAG906_011682 [Vitis piasezkii]